MPRIRNDTDASCVSFPVYPARSDYLPSPNDADDEGDSDVADPLVSNPTLEIPEIVEEVENGTVRFDVDSENAEVSRLTSKSL